MINIGTGVAPVNIVFSSSRNAALIERKMLQDTIITYKTPSLYIERNRNLNFHVVRRLCFCLNRLDCADQKQLSNPDFLTKSIDKTLQTSVDIANEYLQANNTGAGVRSHVFCCLQQGKCEGYTLFLIKFVLSN